MYGPYGLMTPASWVALQARPYMHRYGVTNEDFGVIAVVDRAHAATNPDAWFFERPITITDHQASRWIVEPVLRMLDCCQESDGGVALVVTSVERARDLRNRPAVIAAAAQGAAYDAEMMTAYYREDLTGLPDMGVVADRLWRDAGITPADVSTAFLYDHFTPFVLHAARGARILRARARRRTSRRSSDCRSVVRCRSTRAGDCSARPTSTG